MSDIANATNMPNFDSTMLSYHKQEAQQLTLQLPLSNPSNQGTPTRLQFGFGGGHSAGPSHVRLHALQLLDLARLLAHSLHLRSDALLTGLSNHQGPRRSQNTHVIMHALNTAIITSLRRLAAAISFFFIASYAYNRQEEKCIRDEH